MGGQAGDSAKAGDSGITGPMGGVYSILSLDPGNVITPGDPDWGGRHDPCGFVGIDYYSATRHMYVMHAHQLRDPTLARVAAHLRRQMDTVPTLRILRVESNVKGKKIGEALRARYGIPIKPVYTSGNVSTIKPQTMNKGVTTRWARDEHKAGRVHYPYRDAGDIPELINQMQSIVGVRTPSGQTGYRAVRNRHDDLFSAFVTDCHVVRVIQEYGSP